MKKTKIEFDIERHRDLKHFHEIARALRDLEIDGLVRSRINPISGDIEWQLTEKAIREGIREAADLAAGQTLKRGVRAMTTVKMDSVLWQFAKFYRDKFNADNPGEQIEMNVAAVAMFQAFVANGDAEEERGSDISVWRATPKFLNATGLERGPTISFGLEIN